MKKVLLTLVSVMMGVTLVGIGLAQQGGGGQGGSPWYVSGTDIIIQDSSVTDICNYDSSSCSTLGATGISAVVDDLTPELGGNLDADGKDISNVKILGYMDQDVTIASGIADADHTHVHVFAEGGSGGDNFDGLKHNGFTDGDIIMLSSDSGSTLTVKNNQAVGVGEGNFQTLSGGNFIMRPNIHYAFNFDGTNFYQTNPGYDFQDLYLRVHDDVDPTKQISFQASGISTSTTRIITMADRNIDLDSPTFTDITVTGTATIATLTITGTISGSTEIDGSIGFDSIPTVTYNGTTTTVDWSDSNTQTMTFGAGNIATLAFTDPTAVGQTVKLKLIQDGTGSRVVTAWDSDIQWGGGGTAPTLSTAADSEDWVTCIFTDTGAGERYDCAASLDFQ